jgi:hypothetical protein
MPDYFTPSGTKCSPTDALVAGRLRPGFKECLADGEHMSFGLHMLDAARPGSVFLTDTPADPHAWARQVRDAARDGAMYLPDRSTLNGDTPPNLKLVGSVADSNALVRDLARASQYGG